MCSVLIPKYWFGLSIIINENGNDLLVELIQQW